MGALEAYLKLLLLYKHGRYPPPPESDFQSRQKPPLPPQDRQKRIHLLGLAAVALDVDVGTEASDVASMDLLLLPPSSFLCSLPVGSRVPRFPHFSPKVWQ